MAAVGAVGRWDRSGSTIGLPRLQSPMCTALRFGGRGTPRMERVEDEDEADRTCADLMRFMEQIGNTVSPIADVAPV